MRRILSQVWLPVCLWLSLVASASADEFLLTTGAKIRGAWLNRADRSAEQYHIRTEYGGNVSLARSQVSEITSLSETEQLYERIAPAHADTIDDHWKLACWSLRAAASIIDSDVAARGRRAVAGERFPLIEGGAACPALFRR